MATKKFKCKVCGYIHEGDAAPAKCPVCGAPASEFEEIVEAGAGDAGAKKGGLFSDKNSNAYIILYSTVMVVIVAVLLSLAALSLQQRQSENELGEKKATSCNRSVLRTATSTRWSRPMWSTRPATRRKSLPRRSST